MIRWARYYDSFVSVFTLGRRTQLRQATVALAGIQPGATVLEVGCGTGDVALAACERAGAGGAVYGIDPSPEMIAVARDKAARLGRAVDFQIGVIETLAFPDASFDVVLSSLMMHHLPGGLKQRGLTEIARVLKPGGRLLIVDFKRPTTRWARMMNHLFMHGGLHEGVQDLPALLHTAGFTQVQIGDTRFGMLGFVIGQVAATSAGF
jgi:demethylmenaquinone methyltransferase/2-methoxy-6-polyprenyl-1,4-benzoquinol methylase/phosphoethanolamine N-methyltransferase